MNREKVGMPVWLAILVALAFFYHILTLDISPMPWFDETYFASMTLHFMDSGEFLPQIGPMLEYYYPQSKAYGPAYFLLLSGVYKVFGFGLLQTRIPALIFGFLFLVVLYRILQESSVRPVLRNFAVVLLLFDPIYLQNIHSGRMDSMALLLTGWGIFQLLVGFRKENFPNFMFAGILFGLALLTTPRIAICMFGPGSMALLFFLSAPGWKRFSGLIAIPVLVAGFYSIWVFWGFGGYEEAYNYFFGKPKETLYFQSLAAGYISTRKYVPVFQIPALIVFTFFLGTMLWLRKSTVWVFWMALINLAAYFALVRDTGIYSIFSMPWVYLGLACMTQSFWSMTRTERFMRIVITCLLLANTAIFVLKNTAIWLFSDSRDVNLVESQIRKQIPKGSKVIGDEAYYYFIMNSGSDFQYLDRGASTPQRIDYHTNTFKFDYVVVRNPPSNQYELDCYLKVHPLVEAGKIQMPRPGHLAQSMSNFLIRLKIEIPKGYEGTIYRR